MTLMIQARHLFYGISMLDKYKNMGIKKPYLIFGLCDETFSINYTTKIPDDVDRGWFYFFVTLLNQLYWVSGATLGGLLGNLIKFNTDGLGTVLTRFLPFAVFNSKRPTPKYIQYLGKVLPGAIFAMLVVYCLRNVSIVSGTHGIPELIAIALTVGLHLWKRKMLLSIAGGTICYMLIVQVIL